MNSQITNPQDKNNKVEMSLTVVDPGKLIKNLLDKPYASAYDTKVLMLTQHGRLVIKGSNGDQVPSVQTATHVKGTPNSIKRNQLG